MRTNPFRLNSQNYRLLERLYDGPVTNAEIIRGLEIFNSTGRISDIRKAGFPIKAQPMIEGLWEYKLI